MSLMTQPVAQKQHYVPRFILRNFLAHDREPRKEQVHVFDKHKPDEDGFTTSIANIMAERRFHDFVVGDDLVASFEPTACRLEDEVLPTYRRIIETRSLPQAPEERARLSLLIAFQMIRTRTERDRIADVDQLLDQHLRKFGGSIEQWEGYEPPTEDRLKRDHIRTIWNGIEEYAATIALKDLILLEAPTGRSFYLSDSPVSLNNRRPKPPLGSNLGIGVQGIEIYLPLSADLMLAAWCPSILGDLRAVDAEQRRSISSVVLSPAMVGNPRGEEISAGLEKVGELRSRLVTYIQAVERGRPVLLTNANMDYNNSMQVSDAGRYVVCQQGDFALAREFMKQNPDATGRRLAVWQL